MAENKKSFVLYVDHKELFNELSDEDAGQLIKHIFAYVSDEYPETDNKLVKLSFIPIKLQLKRDLIKYEVKKNQWSFAGKASAEKKRLQKQNNERSTISTNVDSVATVSTVNDNVTVNVNVIKKDREAAKAATLKRVNDFKESLYPYCIKKGGKYTDEMVKEFFNYWSELNKSETKMKWELLQTFQIPNRLATWAKREKPIFGSNQPISNIFKTTD